MFRLSKRPTTGKLSMNSRSLLTLHLIGLCYLFPNSSAVAQTFEEYVALGDSAHVRLDPAAALEYYRQAHLLETQNPEAMWKFARSQIDVAKQITSDDQRERRDSLFGVAVGMALGAVHFDSLNAETHAILAIALGRLSRTKSGRERVRYGKEIYDEAAWALRLDSEHDGAHHVIGAWHAEIKRLSGLTRFVAKTFMGGGYMNMASRDSAVVHLERAVEIRPDYLFHRLELAEVLIELERYADARTHLQAVLDLPPTDVSDQNNKQRAEELLAEITSRH